VNLNVALIKIRDRLLISLKVMLRCLHLFSAKFSINLVPQVAFLKSMSTFDDSLIHYDNHKSVKIDIERLVDSN